MTRRVVVGDPLTKRASYTRFMLPFQWEKRPVRSPGKGSARFRPSRSGDWVSNARAQDGTWQEDRRRYFTPETAELLYGRAGWFVLEEPNRTPPMVWRTIEVLSGLKDSSRTCGVGYKYKVVVRPPALVLMEYSGGAGPPETDEKTFQSGFLVLEAFFPNVEAAPTYEDLLQFNEIFRFWRCPYEKHATDFCKRELHSIRRGFAAGKQGGSGEETIEALYSERWTDFFKYPVVDEKGNAFEFIPKQDRVTSGDGDPVWRILPDDRAFTFACVFLEGDPSCLDPKQSSQAVKSESWAEQVAAGFEDDAGVPALGGHWVKMLNIDRVPFSGDRGSCSKFEYQWALKRTYKRWAHYGTLLPL